MRLQQPHKIRKTCRHFPDRSPFRFVQIDRWANGLLRLRIRKSWWRSEREEKSSIYHVEEWDNIDVDIRTVIQIRNFVQKLDWKISFFISKSKKLKIWNLEIQKSLDLWMKTTVLYHCAIWRSLSVVLPRILQYLQIDLCSSSRMEVEWQGQLLLKAPKQKGILESILYDIGILIASIR